MNEIAFLDLKEISFTSVPCFTGSTNEVIGLSLSVAKGIWA